ncbi:TPM domain-containing protein [Paucibacter sp. DJ1R-11]|uniref:TPM domain-containing protein n=1 Tax=Paucibacter sp. DJ1R-11 TaxID=2893556 RepID=UPI0021E4AF1E|nr:TPM domain-containing protein [Paucibacter sp. DJ1R-11]MCV2364929.1 TPM domain-containing protein [Paucibacter sp. DJ1R-11]
MSKALRLLFPLWLFALLSGGFGMPAWAQDVRPVPVLSHQVMDQTGTLSTAQREALESKLARLERETGTQLVILMVASSQPEDIAAYAQRVGDAWKIGRKDVGDGVLIVVAKDDRKVRIEVAKALEGAVPDLAARLIIQSAITPAFKAGDYAGGLNLAIDQLDARIRGEALPAPTAATRPGAGDSGFDFESLAALFFIGVPLLGAVLTGVFGRKLGSLLSSGLAGTAAGWLASSLLIGCLAGFASLVLVGLMGVGASRSRSGGLSRGRAADLPIIWGGTWSGGSQGGGGGGGGGDFSSGGGGDFGGGGASGDW